MEKGLITSDVVDAVVETYERDVGPLNGAKVVARAWVDGAYRVRLLDDGTEAIGELGFGGAEGEHLVVLENTPTIHNVVVCTLCSCYPWPVLGLPPRWYKSFAYRSRTVREPRAVLAEFGTTLADDVEVRVWDSSADVRYMVLPLRPDGTRRPGRGRARGARDPRPHDRGRQVSASGTGHQPRIVGHRLAVPCPDGAPVGPTPARAARASTQGTGGGRGHRRVHGAHDRRRRGMAPAIGGGRLGRAP